MIEIRVPEPAPIPEAQAPPTSLPSPAEPSADLLRTAQRLFDSGDYGAVLAVSESADIDGDDGLRNLVRRAEEHYVKRAYELYLPPAGMPTLQRSTSDLLQEQLSTGNRRNRAVPGFGYRQQANFILAGQGSRET